MEIERKFKNKKMKNKDNLTNFLIIFHQQMENKSVYVYVDQKPLFILKVDLKTTIKNIMDKTTQYLKENSFVPSSMSVVFKLNKDQDLQTHALYDPSYANRSPYSLITTGESALYFKNMGVMTGNKDVDKMILERIQDDEVLFNYCLTNKYANKICQDQFFWQKRFLRVFGEDAAKYKPADRSWKRHYLMVSTWLSQYKGKEWDFLNHLNIEFFDTKVFFDSDYMSSSLFYPKTPSEYNAEVANLGGRLRGQMPTIPPTRPPTRPQHRPGMQLAPSNYPIPFVDWGEKLKTIFWLLDLGTNVTLEYQIDRYLELDTVEKYYGNEKFTPAKLIKTIGDFYNEKITEDEFNQLVEANDDMIRFYDINDVRNGKVKRINILDRYRFVGVLPLDKETNIQLTTFDKNNNSKVNYFIEFES